MEQEHEFQNTYLRDFSRQVNFFNTDYRIPNIRNTYINSSLHYSFDGYRNYNSGLKVDRPFYSPLAKWAGGVSLTFQNVNDSMKNFNQDYVPLNLKFNTQDFWAGKAFHVFKGINDEYRSTNLILTLRFLRIRYSEKPSAIIDPLRIFSDEDFYQSGIGLSTRRYVRDKYIYNYGITEDVPVGNVYSITTGYQIKNNSGRFYFAMKVSSGNYHQWGYLSSNLEYGTFLKNSKSEQGVISAGLIYFTKLMEIGNWKFRQFVKPEVTIGRDRLSYDTLTLKDGYGLNGFNSFGLSGTKQTGFNFSVPDIFPMESDRLPFWPISDLFSWYAGRCLLGI